MALKDIIFVFALVILTLQMCQPCLALDQKEMSESFAIEKIDLTLDNVHNLVLPNRKFVALSLANITNGTTYLLQLHSQIDNLTLCKSPILTHSSCKNGTNIGLYIETPSAIDADSAGVMWFVKMNSTGKNSTVVSYLHSFSQDAPIPGGCNQVFNMERDGSIELSYQSHQTRLFFQWANERVLDTEADCDSDWVLTDLEYKFYVYFLGGRSLEEQSYLDGMSKMLTLGDILDHGQHIVTIQNEATSKPEILVASEPSRGAIYTIVVRSKSTGSASAYVTAVTYACDLKSGTCTNDLTTGEIIIIIICALVGLYMLFFGHRMFHISQFVFGYVLTFFLAFLLLSMDYGVHRSVILGVSGCIAVIGGGLCLLFWYFFFFPIASVMIPGVCAGYLMAATLFFTPFGRIVWWESNENYILAFICAVLMYAVLLMAFSKFLSILSSSLVGSYLVLMVIAVPLRSSLRLIYLFTEYRQTEKDFEKVKPVAPMAAIDIGLLTLWPVVMILGMVFQYYRERDRPAFERFDLRWKLPDRRKRPRLNSDGQVDNLYETDSATEYDSDAESERSRLLPTPTERTPLLPGAPSSSGVRSPVRSKGINTIPSNSNQTVQDYHEVARSMKEIC